MLIIVSSLQEFSRNSAGKKKPTIILLLDGMTTTVEVTLTRVPGKYYLYILLSQKFGYTTRLAKASFFALKPISDSMQYLLVFTMWTKVNNSPL